MGKIWNSLCLILFQNNATGTTRGLAGSCRQKQNKTQACQSDAERLSEMICSTGSWCWWLHVQQVWVLGPLRHPHSVHGCLEGALPCWPWFWMAAAWQSPICLLGLLGEHCMARARWHKPSGEQRKVIKSLVSISPSQCTFYYSGNTSHSG